MSLQESPIDYAQRIVGVLADTDCGNAKIALRIADALIDQRGRYEMASALAGVHAEAGISEHR
jgi:hypothetical protein